MKNTDEPGSDAPVRNGDAPFRRVPMRAPFDGECDACGGQICKNTQVVGVLVHLDRGSYDDAGTVCSERCADAWETRWVLEREGEKGP